MGMNEICIVTTYQREELLWLCLEAIRREDWEIPIYVFSDRGHESPELRRTVKEFSVGLLQINENHKRYGNSWNVMDAFRCAVNTDADIVHLVEDDTILHPGYFTWAREALRTEPVPAAVCGRICAPHITNWYESPCASWSANHLRIALSHLVPEYFAETRLEMQRVIDEKIFPGSRYKHGSTEQDGFFLRAIEHHKWTTNFPPKPLATHLGAWGYNRPKDAQRPTGSFEERIAFCRALLKDKERRVKLFGKSITTAEMEAGNG